jgi:hypothetical protein
MASDYGAFPCRSSDLRHIKGNAEILRLIGGAIMMSRCQCELRFLTLRKAGNLLFDRGFTEGRKLIWRNVRYTMTLEP